MSRRGLWLAAGGAVAALVSSALAGVVTASMEAPEVASRPGAPSLVERLVPAYPDAPFLPLGDKLFDDEGPRHMAYALTADSPRKVIDRYAGIFASQGLIVERHRRPAPGPAAIAANPSDEEWLSAFFPTEEHLRTLGASRDAEGRTVIFASITSMVETAEPKSPIPPRCEVVTHSGGRDQGARRELIVLDCARTLRDVVGFYDEVLGDTERQTPAGDSAGQTAYIQYTGPGTFVALAAAAAPPHPESPNQPRTQVTLSWEEGP